MPRQKKIKQVAVASVEPEIPTDVEEVMESIQAPKLDLKRETKVKEKTEKQILAQQKRKETINMKHQALINQRALELVEQKFSQYTPPVKNIEPPEKVEDEIIIVKKKKKPSKKVVYIEDDEDVEDYVASQHDKQNNPFNITYC